MNKTVKPGELLLDSHGLSTLLSVLTKDHQDLRELIRKLSDEHLGVLKKKALYRNFSRLLKSHAHCEEKAVYEIASKLKGMKIDTFEANEEHDLAVALMKKIDQTINADQWLGRLKTLIALVEHHMGEEEKGFLYKLKERLKLEKELEMVDQFIICRLHSRDQPSDQFNGVLKDL